MPVLYKLAIEGGRRVPQGGAPLRGLEVGGFPVTHVEKKGAMNCATCFGWCQCES